MLALLKKEIDVSRLQVQIGKQDVDEKLTKQQREFFLREQLKAIKKELGLSKEGKEAELDKFEERLTKLKLPEEARQRVNEELEKLKLLEPASPEYHVSHTYLDWLTILPWGVFTKDSNDIRRSERILNRDHYGLDDVKERILEFLSVGILKGNLTGSILCFVGAARGGEDVDWPVDRAQHRARVLSFFGGWNPGRGRDQGAPGERTSVRCRASSSRRCGCARVRTR